MQPSFSEYRETLQSEVEQSLQGTLDSHLQSGSSVLNEAMRYSLLAPGKRMRPLLVLMATDVCGGDRSQALPAACATEMVHAFSLIHDDLPAMDDDDLRRGQPTNHKVYGEAQAILAGDALLALAFEVLASDLQPELAAACCNILAHATGAGGMTAGQSLDMQGEEKQLELAELEQVHAAKTGALITACLHMGALIASASESEVDALKTYGSCIGLAFQITDDLLDVEGTEADVGKAVQKDAGHAKNTYPAFLGIGQSKAKAAELIAEAVASIQIFGEKAEYLRQLAESILTRNS